MSSILYGILGVYSYYAIFFIHKNIWNMICYMYFVVHIKYYSLYILFIFIFIFLFFCARKYTNYNMSQIICIYIWFRMVYIWFKYGLKWFIYHFTSHICDVIYWFINSESGEDGYVYHFLYVYGSFD